MKQTSNNPFHTKFPSNTGLFEKKNWKKKTSRCGCLVTRRMRQARIRSRFHRKSRLNTNHQILWFQNYQCIITYLGYARAPLFNETIVLQTERLFFSLQRFQHRKKLLLLSSAPQVQFDCYVMRALKALLHKSYFLVILHVRTSIKQYDALHNPA